MAPGLEFVTHVGHLDCTLGSGVQRGLEQAGTASGVNQQMELYECLLLEENKTKCVTREKKTVTNTWLGRSPAVPGTIDADNKLLHYL